MSTAKRPRLTPRDFAIMETMLADHVGGDELLIAAIRKKVSAAQIVFAQDIDADIVTIGSRVVFSVDDGWPQERRLVALEHYVPGQEHQSVASLRGVGLLGQATGDELEIDFGARVMALKIHEVLYQPEAESRAQRKVSRVHLVSNRIESQKSMVRSPIPKTPSDDPGPSAA